MTVNVSARPQRPPSAPAFPPAPARLRGLALEIVKFGIVGGTGVAVNFAVFNVLLHALGTGPMTATVLASSLAMAGNYLGFRFYAYRDRASRTQRQIMLFFVFSGLGVLMESVLFYAAYHGAGLTGPLASNLAKALSIGLASAFRFLVYRTWVFQPDGGAPAGNRESGHSCGHGQESGQPRGRRGPHRNRRKSGHRAGHPCGHDTLPDARRAPDRAARARR
ncbi:GtrA family protein [Streptomyces uncialis]|uniref:GtrA family protein n=1 Tax=Streptomyces uncialis TaxID=1048205 RepID=UPI002E36362B|nr:GtrA family protein [Streptomyces uncialis]